MSRFLGAWRRSGKEKGMNETVIGPSDVATSTPSASGSGDDTKTRDDGLHRILDDGGDVYRMTFHWNAH
jgi:hypothetical protein